ncbi:MAG: peroxiredoxin family protein [Flavobacterium sp.]|nr:peroxiredoxin family protein [Flavobacterium sp.]
MRKFKKQNLIVVIMIALLSLTLQSFTEKKEDMKITEGQTAPVFTVKDVNGKTIKLSDYKGKKVLLTFYRNVGCPICNLRFHEIQEQAEYFKSKNIVVLAIYESSAENMKKYLGDESPYPVMIPNEELNLYQLYDIDKSSGKVIKGLFHGAIGKAKKGKKLFSEPIKQDGNGNTIGADFLIDENGVVKTAYYGKYLGDHLPMENIKKILE